MRLSERAPLQKAVKDVGRLDLSKTSVGKESRRNYIAINVHLTRVGARNLVNKGIIGPARAQQRLSAHGGADLSQKRKVHSVVQRKRCNRS